MKKVSIIVPETAVIEAVADPHYMFRAVNQFLKQQGKEKLFDVEIVGLTKHIELENNLYTVNVNKTINEVDKTDLIIIPAISGDFEEAIGKNLEYIPWLIRHYENGAELASLCVGSFLLASTGLLSGKKCSSHWVSASQFREIFPDVELVDFSIITEENGIYSSGGANSYWALLLYLVEKY
ncbi:MAG: DJ-1/PfpI family protein, partial [Candidatus Kapaibacterium sp.]